jgi:hypothetical protein
MKQYWARHEGKIRWGVRTQLETSEDVYTAGGSVFFVWADRVELREGSLVFLSEGGQLQAALAPGRWDAVFEATTEDVPRTVETRR